MATDILTTTAPPPAHSRSQFPRSLAISDLDLRDDRYPLISSPRRVSPTTHQGPPSSNVFASPTPFYPDAVRQAVRGTSRSSSVSPPHDLKSVKTPSLRLAPAKSDAHQVSDERRSMFHTDSQSSPLNAGSPPTSYPLDHVQPTNVSSSMRDINLKLFGPSQSSQASSGQVSRLLPLSDIPQIQHPRASQPSSPWQSSPRDTHPTELYTPSPRSAAAASLAQGVQLPSSRSQGMRMSTAAQYSPTIGIPVSISSSPRVQAQQPSYINPSPTPTPINPVFTSRPLPPEEVCVECAMRDQDMADVDVTSPGIWDRESDAHYEELLRRELEEEELGVPPQEPHRPRARGGRLTVANLKLWLSLNPKEPASKGEALEKYVKAQQALVEAEALAHARALLESRQLEDRMRGAYSQLRRSAYELGANTPPGDSGVRAKTLRSSMLHLPSQTNGHGREVTVLENGMIVEHVDVRKEDRDERQHRRREEKRARARKSSRGSAFDVTSTYSSMSPLLNPDTGSPIVPSRSSTSRPMSVSTSLIDTFSRSMQSNPSIEALSMVSAGASPRRTRFLGLRNLSPSFISSDSLAPSGFSGSMVDMHLALQSGGERLNHSPVEPGDRYQTIASWRDGSALIPQRRVEQKIEEEKPKKKKGLAKIWGLVTGSSKHNSAPLPQMSQARSLDGVHDDDYPLAPPPPLSYLVSRGTGDNGGSALRHVSTPSLPSSASPNYPLSSSDMSPPTAPSSLLPSPTSSRPVVITDFSETRKTLLADSDAEQLTSPVPEEDRLQTPATQRGVHPTTSEPDLRRRASQVLGSAIPPVPRIPSSATHSTTRTPLSTGWRDKMLPPLPGETQSRPPTFAQGETRSRTVSSFDMREVNGAQVLVAPQAPFASTDRRRQSFNGLGNLPPGLVARTLPARRTGFDPEKYVGFGGSHDVSVPALPPMQRPPKRKSKFGLASLLGRKAAQDSEPTEFPLGRSSGSEARHEAEMGMRYGNLMANSGSEHAFPRLSMSLVTRKNIENLVDQSPDFVSYRYPSGDQSLMLS